MKKRLIIQLFIILILLMTTVAVAHAYRIDPNYKPINQPLGLEEEALGQKEATGEGAVAGTLLILNLIAGGLLFFAAPVGVISIAVAGGMLVIQGQDTDKIEQAKKHLTWAIVGLLLIILAYSIVRIIITVTIETAGG